MTPYDRGFFTKCAQAGLSAEDAAALKAFLAQQKEDQQRRETQHEQLKKNNRSERRTNGILGGVGLGGIGGAALGGLAGGKWGALAGGLGGAVGGGFLGNWLGNRRADKMEQRERDTGVSLQDQLAEARQKALAWQLLETRMHQGMMHRDLRRR